MKNKGLAFALALSVLLNLGVVGAAGYRALARPLSDATDLATRLRLDPSQRERWHALEEGFVRELDAGWRDIAAHRESLVREVFSNQPDAARVEAERASIAQLQVQQQQRVIAQFLREREILDAQQRRALVDLLLHEEHKAPVERQLHGG
jgi:Spy/CpxP family protein refolding chaperone